MLAGCNLSATPTPPPATPDLPRVLFQEPQNNSRVVEGFEINVDIVAADETQGIGRIEFLVDNVLVQEGTPPDGVVPVFRANVKWVAQGIGMHSLSAVAYRPDGTPSDVTTIVIEVIPPPL